MSRPTVVRTYGKSKPSASSSCSLIFESSPPTSPLLTPQASSDIDQVFEFSTRQYSDNRNGKENAPIESSIKHNSIPKEKSSSSQSTLADFFTLPPPSRKRPLQPSSVGVGGKPKKSKDEKQMHLTHLPLLHTCSQCQMSYVRGGDDESLHEKHHAKVTRGSIWDGLGRGRVRKKNENGIGIGIGEKDCGWRVVKDNVPFGPGGKGKGKVIVADGSYGGAKLDDILKTVDTVLSSPPLPSAIMAQCKIFLFITSSPAPSRRLQPRTTSDRTPKERVVAIVVSQPIKWAMKLIGNTKAKVSGDQTQLPLGGTVDSGDGVLCDSTPLPTPLGIHRLFTIPTYRSLGLAQLLLDAACQYTIPGISYDPTKGQVAFSQPTNSGRITMEKWGKGMVRVFVDDESQL